MMELTPLNALLFVLGWVLAEMVKRLLVKSWRAHRPRTDHRRPWPTLDR